MDLNGALRSFATGSKVIIGNIPPGKLYATIGDTDVYLGPVEIVETHERARNEYIVQAERMAVAVWNVCATFASDDLMYALTATRTPGRMVTGDRVAR